MSARQTIDSLRFAKTGERLSGEYSVRDLPRLADVLAPGRAVVEFRLEGVTSSGRPTLRLVLRATVVLVCQRCLEPFEQDMELDRHYPVARDDAELARWERDDPLLEGLLADPRLVLSELLEDEVLLGLPTVPRHDDGDCEPVRVN